MNIRTNYNNYLDAYKRYYGPNDDNYIDKNSDKGITQNSANWKVRAKKILKDIDTYGTFEEQQKQDAFNEIEKEYKKYLKAYADYYTYTSTEDMYNYKDELIPASFWVKETSKLQKMLYERNEERKK